MGILKILGEQVRLFLKFEFKTVEITKQERKSLITKISKASGIAQYALIKKMTDEQVVAAAEHLEVFQLVKDASNYNRHCQKLKTQEANKKLQEFLNPERSELVKAGKWLVNALSKTGSDRKQTLLEKELVHKENYNETVSDMGETITTILTTGEEATEDAKNTISELEKRIDSLKGQLLKVQGYISNNYGPTHWIAIKDTFDIK